MGDAIALLKLRRVTRHFIVIHDLCIRFKIELLACSVTHKENSIIGFSSNRAAAKGIAPAVVF